MRRIVTLALCAYTMACEGNAASTDAPDTADTLDDTAETSDDDTDTTDISDDPDTADTSDDDTDTTDTAETSDDDTDTADTSNDDTLSVDDGTDVDTTPEPTCTIDGVDYLDGVIHPTNPCQVCDFAASPSAWTDVMNGTACGDGRICGAGICAPQCFIDGAIHADDAANPIESCQSCQPTLSTTTWTPIANGNICGDGLICEEGVCGAGCYIDDVAYDPETPNPANTCQTCAASVSTDTWTAEPDGAACATSMICDGGTCTSACFIDDTTHADGDVNTANLCQTCDASASNYTWADRALGSACDTAKVCNAAHACVAGCFIDNAVRAPDSLHTNNFCRSCQPNVSTTAWTNRPVGTGCVTGYVCNASAQCVQGCGIGGIFYAANAVNPDNACLQCQPSNSTTAWSHRDVGTTCGTGRYCSLGSCSRGALFSHTGDVQTWNVPAGTTRITVTAVGGAGGAIGIESLGGVGGLVKATLAVTSGETLRVRVGGGGSMTGNFCNASGGWNGGGNGGTYGSGRDGCGGGGGSDVRRGGTDIGRRVLVAGGGGGGGGKGGVGGNGGGSTGANGMGGLFQGGGGGKQVPGQSVGSVQNCNSPCVYYGGPSQGGAGYGGNGGDTSLGGGGGGGGGYYGGSGGQDSGMGGGGGSGWAIDAATDVTSMRRTGTGRGQHGVVVISY